MIGTKQMTREELKNFIDENFKDAKDNDIICALFYINDWYDEPCQQCILFNKEVSND